MLQQPRISPSYLSSNINLPVIQQVNNYSPVVISNHHLQNMNCILGATANEGGLYLGDIISILKGDVLLKHNIQAVLTCMHESSHIKQMPQQIVCHKTLPIQDLLNFPIIQYFTDATDFIDKMRKSKYNVLVHCHAGVSRSAAIVCAYLITKYQWSLQASLDFVRSKRARAKPNQSFINQLIQFHKQTILQVKNPEKQKIAKTLQNKQYQDEYQQREVRNNHVEHLSFKSGQQIIQNSQITDLSQIKSDRCSIILQRNDNKTQPKLSIQKNLQRKKIFPPDYTQKRRQQQLISANNNPIHQEYYPVYKKDVKPMNNYLGNEMNNRSYYENKEKISGSFIENKSSISFNTNGKEQPKRSLLLQNEYNPGRAPRMSECSPSIIIVNPRQSLSNNNQGISHNYQGKSHNYQAQIKAQERS